MTRERSSATAIRCPRPGRCGPPAGSANANYQQFEIVRLADNEAIGITVLQINQYVRTAEFVIVLAPTERGKGYATEATRLTLDWAFHLAALRMV